MSDKLDPLILTFAERNSILLMIFTILLSFFYIRFILNKAKKSTILNSFVFVHTLSIIWSLGLILEQLAIHQEIWLRWGSLYVSYIGICFFSFAWLLFCGYYTNSRFTSKKIYIILISVPFFIFYFLLLTNNYHQLFYIIPEGERRQLGPAYWGLVAVSYVYLSCGFALLIRFALISKGVMRIQTLLIFISCILMFILNIFRIVYQFPIETTPITVSISTSIIFTYASVKYRLFNIVPMSSMTFIESIEQGILIIDKGDTIVGYNKALTNILQCKNLIRENEPVKPLITYLKSVCSIESDTSAIVDAFESKIDGLVKGHMQINFNTKRYYDVTIQPVIGNRGKMVGRIISLNDVTKIHLLNIELKEKNTELEVMNESLNEANEVLLDHALSVEELSITKERNRILNDMHDSIGQTYTVILSLINVGKSFVEDNFKAQQVLSDMYQIAKEGLNEIRASIYNQRNRSIENSSIINTLEKLFQGFEKSGIKVNLLLEGTPQSISYETRHVIYRLCQEALNNSLKHGLANEVYVIIEYKKDSIRIFILDNGKGCIHIVKGVGLTAMEQRVQSLNGTISYGSQEDEAGFYIQIELPV